MVRLALFFLAALAWGQESNLPTVKDGKIHVGDGCLRNAECGSIVKKAEEVLKRADDLQRQMEDIRVTFAEVKQENERLQKLLNWYQQQFFILQARQIEQQIAPKEPPKPTPAKPQGETK